MLLHCWFSFCIFFFSSRRRHTRYLRDWSSDVCSSDLPVDGISVPVEKIDVVFIPLLAFDQKGHRVGYGKGFYDTFLARCRPRTLKVGLSLFEPELGNIEDVHEKDIALDYGVTPNKVYTF